MPRDKERDISEEVMGWDHQQSLVCVLSILHDPQLRAGFLGRVPHMEQFRAQTPGEVGVTPYGVSKLIRLAAATLNKSSEKTKEGQKLAVDEKSNTPTKSRRCHKDLEYDEAREKRQMCRSMDNMWAASATKNSQSTPPVPDSTKTPSPERSEKICKNCGVKFLARVEN